MVTEGGQARRRYGRAESLACDVYIRCDDFVEQFRRLDVRQVNIIEILELPANVLSHCRSGTYTLAVGDT